MEINPFTPTFGIVPPYLAGRNMILKDMATAFEKGPGDPNLSALFVGPRGCGKTALLSCIGGEAARHGWLSVNAVAGEGMLEDIIQQVVKNAAEFSGKKNKRSLKEVSLGNLIGLQWDNNEQEMNWRSKMTSILEELGGQDIGLLISVDEVTADAPEMLTLAADYQLLLTDGMKVALIMAGLPTQADELVSNKRVSFLRRAKKRYLGLISDIEIETAFRKTVEGAGKTIDPKALSLAVRASGGYAYMMQLVGYSMWDESDDRPDISVRDAEYGIRRAEAEFRDGALRSTVMELSNGDINFLKAMLEDDKASRMADISKRIGKPSNYTSTYKSRLLRAGVIEEQARGVLVFSLPGLREYLAEI